ncbi:MAG: CotH kinase family protein [Verrucomicrobiales bacterium]|nr:CotH kinase family protein [Verrucomicrobiales bacterium]
MGIHHLLIFGILLLACSTSGAPREDLSDHFFTNGALKRLKIQISEDAVKALRAEPRQYVKCTVTEGGQTYRDVAVHLKGNYGTFKQLDGKASLTLNFDKFVGGQKLHGLDKFHLNNSEQDPTYLCEFLSSELFRKAGIPAARVAHAQVELNGRDLGLYVLLEGLDKTFLRKHFQNPDGNLYESEFSRDIDVPLKRNSGKGASDHSDLRALMAAIAIEDDRERLLKLTSLVDMERVFSFLALELIARHADGYTLEQNNYRLYFDPIGSKAVLIPHGMDQMFVQPQAPLLPELKGQLAKAILHPSMTRQFFRDRCSNLLPLLAGLTNRLEDLLPHVRTFLEDGELEILRRYDDASTDLCKRLALRVSHLESQLRPAIALPIAIGQTVSLTNLVLSVEEGSVRLGKVAVNTNDTSYELRIHPHEGSVKAVLQLPMLLPAGSYRMTLFAVSELPVFKGQEAPIKIGIWGLSNLGLEIEFPTKQSGKLSCVFELRHSPSEEVLGEIQLNGLFNTQQIRGGLVLERLR